MLAIPQIYHKHDDYMTPNLFTRTNIQSNYTRRYRFF